MQCSANTPPLNNDNNKSSTRDTLLPPLPTTSQSSPNRWSWKLCSTYDPSARGRMRDVVLWSTGVELVRQLFFNMLSKPGGCCEFFVFVLLLVFQLSIMFQFAFFVLGVLVLFFACLVFLRFDDLLSYVSLHARKRKFSGIVSVSSWVRDSTG